MVAYTYSNCSQNTDVRLLSIKIWMIFEYKDLNDSVNM